MKNFKRQKGHLILTLVMSMYYVCISVINMLINVLTCYTINHD